MSITTLNAAQKQAVTTTTGRVLILAGAGSGKTKVLTARICHLLSNCHVPPESILGLTFTNKAAEEMRSRLSSFVGNTIAKRVMLSTFHSFCMWVLRREAHHLGYTTDFTIYDRQDVLRLVTSIARDILEHDGEMPSLTKTLDSISLAKNRGQSPEEFTSNISPWYDNFAKEVYKRLHDSLRAYNAVDFDHLLWLTAELFTKKPDVLKRYQKRFSHVMIDEYQDTNPIQAKIATLLTAESKNLCVVGDDDQSIYSWRGADVANILRFDDASIVKLEQNFRSTNGILKAANHVIDCNAKRHKKRLWSDKGEGEKIEVFYAPTEAHEAEGVVTRLLEIKEKRKLAWRDFAILYRSNSLARPIESALLRQRILTEDKRYIPIPYQVYGGDEFYEHKEIKDLLSYLRVIANPLDHEALIRVINYPRRGVGESALDTLTSIHRSQGIPLSDLLQQPSLEVSDRAISGIREFTSIMEWGRQEFKNGQFAKGLDALVQKIEFQKAICEEVKSEALKKWKLGNIEELKAALHEYEIRTEKPTLSDFLSSTLLNNDERHWVRTHREKDDHVHLMTFHSSKGLEFKVCFLIGLEDHLIPHEKSLKENSLEEERRLLYVAMTRAQEYLCLTMSSRRKRMGVETPSQPSRFLFEIPKELLNVTRWDQK